MPKRVESQLGLQAEGSCRSTEHAPHLVGGEGPKAVDRALAVHQGLQEWPDGLVVDNHALVHLARLARAVEAGVVDDQGPVAVSLGAVGTWSYHAPRREAVCLAWPQVGVEHQPDEHRHAEELPRDQYAHDRCHRRSRKRETHLRGHELPPACQGASRPWTRSLADEDRRLQLVDERGGRERGTTPQRLVNLWWCLEWRWRRRQRER